MAKFIKNIKKQIDKQTREKIGNVRIDTEGSIFRQQSTEREPEEYPAITWDKASYTYGRGEYFNLNPNTFQLSTADMSYQKISSINGNFSDTSPSANYNVRYSGIAGISGGGAAGFRINASNCSISVWVNNTQIYTSGSQFSYSAIDFTFSIEETAYLQIFWYTNTTGNTISIEGDLATYLTSWAESDTTPFYLPVLWYDQDAENPPISSGYLWGRGNYVNLRWWFGGGETETIFTSDPATLGARDDLGGFGVYKIDFLLAGDLAILTDDIIAIYGNYVNYRYIRSNDGTLLTVESASLAAGNIDRTEFTVPNHGLDGVENNYQDAYVGISRHITDIPLSLLSNISEDVFTTSDFEVIRGETVYYFIDHYDTSPSKNRGGMTTSFQTIIVGDFIAPDPVTGLTATRNSIDSVTLEWDDASFYEISRWNVYNDAASATYTADAINGTSINISNISDFEIKMAENPGGFLISVQGTGGDSDIKYIRTVTSVLYVYMTIDEAIPETWTSGQSIRFVDLIQTVDNRIIGVDPAGDDETLFNL